MTFLIVNVVENIINIIVTAVSVSTSHISLLFLIVLEIL